MEAAELFVVYIYYSWEGFKSAGSGLRKWVKRGNDVGRDPPEGGVAPWVLSANEKLV